MNPPKPLQVAITKANQPTLESASLLESLFKLVSFCPKLISRAQLLLFLPYCCALKVSVDAPSDVFTFEKNHVVSIYALPAFEWVILWQMGTRLTELW